MADMIALRDEFNGLNAAEALAVAGHIEEMTSGLLSPILRELALDVKSVSDTLRVFAAKASNINTLPVDDHKVGKVMDRFGDISVNDARDLTVMLKQNPAYQPN